MAGCHGFDPHTVPLGAVSSVVERQHKNSCLFTVYFLRYDDPIQIDWVTVMTVLITGRLAEVPRCVRAAAQVMHECTSSPIPVLLIKTGNGIISRDIFK